MKFQLLPSPKGSIARLVQEDGWKIGGLDDFLDLIASSPSDTIALADFIRESNRTGKVVFVPGLEEAVALLR